MTRNISEAAQVAKLVKKFITSKGVKCSSKSSTYSMGDSVRVKYNDISPELHNEIKAHCAKYKEGHFDGMTDMYESSNRRSDIPQTKYLFIDNRFSDELYAEAWAWIRDNYPSGNTKALPEDYEEAKNRDFFNTDNLAFVPMEYEVRHLIGGLLSGNTSFWDKQSKEFWESRQPVKVDPVSVGETTISEHTHTKKGFQMFIVELSGRVDRDQFNELRDTAKEQGGWYSRKWGDTPAGFAFKELATAEQFAQSISSNDNSTTSAPKSQPKKKGANPEILRKLAEKMQSTIDNKLGDRLENTPKRMAQAANSRLEGYRQQRCQQLFYKMADAIEAGTLPDILADVKTKTKAYDLMASETTQTGVGFHYYSVCTGKPRSDANAQSLAAWALLDGGEEQRELDEIKALENQIKLNRPDGFFPTPDVVIDQMLDRADIQPGMDALEPSAGSGSILAKLPAGTHAIEQSHALQSLLHKKGFSAEQCDFLTHAGEYDRIVMNPPFEKQADIKHVNHAFSLLREGGRLVAIMSGGVAFRSDKLTESFRSLIDECGELEHLPDQAFKESGTNVSTVMVTLNK